MVNRFLSDFSGLSKFRTDMSILMFRAFIKKLVSQNIKKGTVLYNLGSDGDEEFSGKVVFPKILARGRILIDIQFMAQQKNSKSMTTQITQEFSKNNISLDKYKGCISPDSITNYLKNSVNGFQNKEFIITKISAISDIWILKLTEKAQK
jgi:hypothetical protein